MKRLLNSLKFYRLMSIIISILTLGWYIQIRITEEILGVTNRFLMVMSLVIISLNLIILDLILSYLELRLKKRID